MSDNASTTSESKNITQEEIQPTPENQTTWEEMTLAEEVEEMVHATPYEIKKVKDLFEPTTLLLWKSKHGKIYIGMSTRKSVKKLKGRSTR